MPAPHPLEFRRRAVELARQKTKPVAELAKELQISESCLRNWMAQAEVDDNGSMRNRSAPEADRSLNRALLWRNPRLTTR